MSIGNNRILARLASDFPCGPGATICYLPHEKVMNFLKDYDLKAVPGYRG